MPAGDLYEVTLTQEAKGVILVNVFHYYQALGFLPIFSSEAAVLATNFREQVLPLITAWQPVDIVTTSIRARNLYEISDDYSIQTAIPGAYVASTQMLPLFTGVAFTLSGDNAAVKNGSKRFAGMVEETQDDGVINNAILITQLNSLADKLEGYITVGTAVQDNCFKSVIVKRVREGVKPDYTYRMPKLSAEGVFSNVIVAAFRALITSQVSRKIRNS